MAGLSERIVPTKVSRPSRQQLLFEFDLQREAAVNDDRAYQYFICDAYLPSAKPKDALAPIRIEDLQPGTHHTGRILFMRTIETPVRLAAIQTIVEDETGQASRLSLYNSSPAIEAQTLLPEQTVFAVKEPFYWLDGGGTAVLRVDHLSDLVLVNPFDSAIPQAISSDPSSLPQSAEDWKAKGNEAYGAQRFLAAHRAYTCGLDVCKPKDTNVRHDMFRNRAVVNIFLKHYHEASTDAEAAIIHGSDRTDVRSTALNVKAYERLAHSAYELGNFERARTSYEHVLELAPNNIEAKQNLKRIAERMREQDSGEYDFARMSISSSKKSNRLDFASFTQLLQVQATQSRGRGLFANEDIQAGKVVLVEKATCVAFETDKIPHQYAILDPKTERGLTGSQAILLFNLVEKLLYNMDLASKILKLYAGPEFSDHLPENIGGLLTIDAFRVKGIVEHNSFECPSIRSSSYQSSQNSSKYKSTGLWFKAAHINHACDGNVMRAFIGDMIIVRAARNIKKGEEILMPYQLPDAINVINQEKLRKTWGFECDCRICKAEAASSYKQRRDRSQLIERARTYLKDVSSSSKPLDWKTSTNQIVNLVSKLKSTYDDEIFATRPRLGLVPLGFWLCKTYLSRRSYNKTVETALEVLRDLGFLASIEGSTLSVDRSNCQVDGTAMDVAMYAAYSFNSQKNSSLAIQFQEFATSLYLLMYGELRGFEDRYKEQLIPSNKEKS